MRINCVKAGVPEGGPMEAAIQFQWKHSDGMRSSSACGHLGSGWFVIYDFPVAEKWARECAWETTNHRCLEHLMYRDPEPNSYTLVHFPDPKGEIEMKLRWC